MTALIGTVVLLVGFAFIAWWSRLDARREAQWEARAHHPSNFDQHASEAIDLTRDVDVLMADIESYLKMRQPPR